MQTNSIDDPNSQTQGEASENGGGSSSVKFQNPKKSKPIYALPSDRVASDKQLEILRGFVAAVDAESGPVTNEQAGKIVSMAGATVVVTNAFFVDTGLLVRTDAGTFNVGQAARDYQAAYQWDMMKAGRKLAPAFVDKWFCKVLVPRLKMRAYLRTEAVTLLAEACKASPEYRPRLEMIIDFLNAAGIVSADTAEVRLGAVEEGGDSRESGSGNGGGGGNGGGPPKTPATDQKDEKDEIPADAPFIYLDPKKAKRVVLVTNVTELKHHEWKRLEDWFKLQFFVDADPNSKGTNTEEK